MSSYLRGDNAPKPLSPPENEQEIVESWASEELLVSVICQTYQHSKYIRDALDGFLAQKTKFRFEVLVRDDCSTDGTAEIIREYEGRYPSIVKGIYEPFNKWPSVKPGAVLRELAQGKYVAECEGDDYWIDERKLQKQVDYLESHQDVVLLKTQCVWIDGRKIIEPAVSGGTRTHLFRNHLNIPLTYLRFIYFGDVYYQAMLARHGKIAALNDVTAVWRKHGGGVFGSMTGGNERVLNLHRSQTQAWIAQQFFDDGDRAAANRHMAASVQCFLRAMKGSDLVAVFGRLVYSAVRRSGGKVLRTLRLRS